MHITKTRKNRDVCRTLKKHGGVSMGSLNDLLVLMGQNPLLLTSILLTLGVILVNGWTDAPNAIATCIVTRCMSPNAAILMAAVFNFLGVLLMTLIRETTYINQTRVRSVLESFTKTCKLGVLDISFLEEKHQCHKC